MNDDLDTFELDDDDHKIQVDVKIRKRFDEKRNLTKEEAIKKKMAEYRALRK